MLTLQSDRLQELRRVRGIGRTKLAKLAGLTERQIARLEGALPMKGDLTADVALRLAAALQVEPETLLGDKALTDMDLARPARSCSCC